MIVVPSRKQQSFNDELKLNGGWRNEKERMKGGVLKAVFDPGFIVVVDCIRRYIGCTMHYVCTLHIYCCLLGIQKNGVLKAGCYLLVNIGQYKRIFLKIKRLLLQMAISDRVFI